MPTETRAIRTAWFRGFTAALATLAEFDADTIYDEVVRSGEPEAVIQQARRDGAIKWSGLSGYIRRQKENA